MATRHHQAAAAAPQPENRGFAAPTGKQAAAGRPRQPLGDIGNLVHAQLPEEGINRPITRSFGAQLLKNNRALTNKKPAEGADENRKAGCAHKLPRKKVVNTLTAVLSHRSKEACGLNRKPKELVEDIDKLDGDNELAVVDYIDDIYSYYRTAQLQSLPVHYMGSQPEINPKMRAILVDWLVEVAHKFELMPESFYLTVYVIDRFLSMEVVPRRELQLLGVAAMLIACKYEEIWAPEVSDFIHISDNSYSRQQILGMEKSILNRMSWNLTVPTPYVFLVRFAKAAGAGSDRELEHMVFFFAEVALMEYGLVSLCPSLVAASVVYAARCTLKKTPVWTETLKHHTGYNDLHLMEPAKVLVASHTAAPQSKLKAVYMEVFRRAVWACGTTPSCSSLVILGSFEPRKSLVYYLRTLLID